MIQINLLPSIKAEYVKAQRTKRTAIVIAAITISVSLGAVALLAGVAFGAQKVQLANVQDDINENSAKITSIQDLDKILTIQNQMNTLDPLHDAKPVMSRLFTYIQQVTPANVTINRLDIAIEDYRWELSGEAVSVETINKFVDTLKFTEVYQADPDAEKQYAFSEVVLTSFGVPAETTPDAKASYKISLKYNDQLFLSENQEIKLVVPAITTTRSQTELPAEQIFAPSTNQEEQ